MEDGKLSNKPVYQMELDKETVVMAEWLRQITSKMDRYYFKK